jgi:hypothetical protein
MKKLKKNIIKESIHNWGTKKEFLIGKDYKWQLWIFTYFTLLQL